MSVDSGAAGALRRRNPERLARNSPGKLAVKTRSMRLKRKQRKEKEHALEVNLDEDDECADSDRKPGQVLSFYHLKICDESRQKIL